jgi:hypothetical protein
LRLIKIVNKQGNRRNSKSCNGAKPSAEVPLAHGTSLTENLQERKLFAESLPPTIPDMRRLRERED